MQLGVESTGRNRLSTGNSRPFSHQATFKDLSTSGRKPSEFKIDKTHGSFVLKPTTIKIPVEKNVEYKSDSSLEEDYEIFQDGGCIAVGDKIVRQNDNLDHESHIFVKKIDEIGQKNDKIVHQNNNYLKKSGEIEPKNVSFQNEWSGAVGDDLFHKGVIESYSISNQYGFVQAESGLRAIVVREEVELAEGLHRLPVDSSSSELQIPVKCQFQKLEGADLDIFEAVNLEFI